MLRYFYLVMITLTDWELQMANAWGLNPEYARDVKNALAKWEACLHRWMVNNYVR